MAEWMYAHTLPVEDHPWGCTCGGCGFPSDEYDEEGQLVSDDDFEDDFDECKDGVGHDWREFVDEETGETWAQCYYCGAIDY